MKKTRKPPSKGNVTKALSYEWAVGRIDAAITAGFFLEAVSIEESIISDRIWSHVHGESGGKRRWKDHETTLGALIREWRSHGPPSELLAAVDGWRSARNRAMHGAAKSQATTPTPTVEDFLKDAKRTAKDGRRVMRQVMGWHKKVLAAHLKRQRQAGH